MWAILEVFDTRAVLTLRIFNEFLDFGFILQNSAIWLALIFATPEIQILSVAQ